MSCRAVLHAFALILAGAPLAGQQLSVSASVPVSSPLGAGVRDLTFGTVTPLAGQIVDVDVVAAVAPENGTVQSAEFRYGVSALRGLDFTVQVPAVLTSGSLPPLSVSSGGAQYGGYCVTTAGSACVLTGFDPAGPSVRVCRQTVGSGSCHPVQAFPALSELSVYVGARLSVPASAAAATYTGTITLTIVQVY